MRLRFNKLLWLGILLPIVAFACRASIPTNQEPQSVFPPNLIPTAVPPVSQVIQLPPMVADEQGLLVELYKKVNPSVVNLTLYTQMGDELIATSQGSGFVYDATGHILTNGHVVTGAELIEVGFSDGTIREAELVGIDPNSDLAMIKIENPPAEAGPLPLAQMDDVQVGQTVVAIGNAFGWDGTLTRGIVSAIGRNIPTLTAFSIPKAIQTDAPINPGNSGGPLLNLQGEVIGVNAQIITDGENRANSGVGFAIPVNIVERVAPALISKGEFIWPWLGVRGTDLNSIYSQAMGINIEKGAYITDIVPDGPAQKANLHGASGTKKVSGRTVSVGGDIITAINGQPIESFDDLLIYIALETRPGDKVTLTILRDGAQQDISLTLEPRPAALTTDVVP